MSEVARLKPVGVVYNNSYGIYLWDSSNNEIHYCNIYDNTDYGVYNYYSEIGYQVDATHNWWGSADGPSGVCPGRGDAVSSNVLYDPWLGEEAKPPEIPWLYIIISVIIIIVLAATGIGIRRRKKALPPKKPV